jgi:hypothetical protein
MTIHPKLKPVIYGLIVFIIFISLSIILKMLTHRVSSTDVYFGVLSNKDMVIGFCIAVFLTFTNEQKKKLRK